MPEAKSLTDTVTCGPFVAGGDSLVRREGMKTMFVRGGLPGERAKVEITLNKKDLQRSNVIEVLEKSPDRVEPPCPMFKRGCGGCQWQHASIEAQHNFKIEIVKDALKRIAKTEDIPLSFGGSVSPTGYRTTLRLQVSDGKASLIKRNSHDNLQLETCLIAHPSLLPLITDVDYKSLKEVTIRVSTSTNERMVYTHGVEVDLDLPSDVIVTVDGKDRIFQDICDRQLRVSAKSFFQSGPEAATLLTETVDSFVPEDIDWLVDAYAGVGLFSSVIGSRRDCRVTAIEQTASSINDAKSNLSHLRSNIVEAEVSEIERPGMERPDVVIADPPRSGLGPSATRALASLEADRLILVSCDPASLARDVNLLREHKYKPKQVVVLDLFPHSHHVETVTVFDR